MCCTLETKRTSKCLDQRTADCDGENKGAAITSPNPPSFHGRLVYSQRRFSISLSKIFPAADDTVSFGLTSDRNEIYTFCVCVFSETTDTQSWGIVSGKLKVKRAHKI